jgi:hypothetical protein
VFVCVFVCVCMELRFREEDSTRVWQQFQLAKDIIQPDYEVPYTALEVATSLLSAYDSEHSSMVNIVLPFHSTPAWPLLRSSNSKEKVVVVEGEQACFCFYYCAGDGCVNTVVDVSNVRSKDVKAATQQKPDQA